jgi:ribosomal protein L7/L12
MDYVKQTGHKIADAQLRISALLLAIRAHFSTRAEANADLLEALARDCEDSLCEADVANLNAIESAVFVRVELTAIGDKKIGVIKEVCRLTGLGLTDAKSLVERAPSLLKGSVPASDATRSSARLSAWAPQ